jgi:hypothetical protein
LKGRRKITNVLVQAGWDDSPHLTKKQIDEQLADMRPHQMKARTKGIPQVGAGAIYPIAEDDIKCRPFEIPDSWPKGYALDVGWNRTAALWGALDRQSDCLYLWSEHYLGEASPPVHASAIRARGAWMMGVVDPASHGRSQDDGERLFSQYTQPVDAGGQGLLLALADNAVDAGVDAVWNRMVSSRLKAFDTLLNFFYEFRLYKRDEKGRIVKLNDHLMDDLRYMCNGGTHVFLPTPPSYTPVQAAQRQTNLHKSDWNMHDSMARDLPRE